jgi:hypothetical protein
MVFPRFDFFRLTARCTTLNATLFGDSEGAVWTGELRCWIFMKEARKLAKKRKIA